MGVGRHGLGGLYVEGCLKVPPGEQAKLWVVGTYGYHREVGHREAEHLVKHVDVLVYLGVAVGVNDGYRGALAVLEQGRDVVCPLEVSGGVVKACEGLLHGLRQAEGAAVAVRYQCVVPYHARYDVLGHEGGPVGQAHYYGPLELLRYSRRPLGRVEDGALRGLIEAQLDAEGLLYY